MNFSLPYSFKTKISKHKSGQTFVEIIISVGLAGMVVAAILVLNAASSKVGTSSLKRSQASKIAVLAIESVRYYRDSRSYNSLQTGCYKIATEANANASLASSNCSIYETVNFEGNLFERKIEVSSEDAQTSSRKITVTVRWPEATGTKSGLNTYKHVIINTILSRW